jgi:hypothetical protein
MCMQPSTTHVVGAGTLTCIGWPLALQSRPRHAFDHDFLHHQPVGHRESLDPRHHAPVRPPPPPPGGVHVRRGGSDSVPLRGQGGGAPVPGHHVAVLPAHDDIREAPRLLDLALLRGGAHRWDVVPQQCTRVGPHLADAVGDRGVARRPARRLPAVSARRVPVR